MNRSSAIAVTTLLLSAAGAHAQAFERQVFQMIRTSAASVKLVQAQAQQPSAADQQTTQSAREAYYSATAAGFQGLQADLRPDWAVAFGRPLTSEEQQIIDGFKFQIAVDANGRVDLTTAGSTIPQEMSEDFARRAAGLQQTMQGFFAIWSSFMLTNPLPYPGTPYVLKREPKLYRYSYKEGDMDFSVTLLKNYAITEVILTEPSETSKITPSFTPTQDGFVLTRYDGDEIPTADPTRRTIIRVDIAYQVVDGVQVPKRIAIDGTYASRPIKAAFDLDNCVVQKRTP